MIYFLSAHWDAEGVGSFMTRMEVYFSGRVQGVGFRYRVKALVAGYYVSGTIKNLSDGRVHLAAEGQKDELEAFLQGIIESELGSHIRDVELHWNESRGNMKGFKITG